jgi:anti-sigma regulatory factor (Ser/Thr protein kinase)
VRIAARLPSVESSARGARDLLRECLGDKLPAVTLYDLLTVVSELMTNAVRHGEGDEVGLAVVVADGKVTGEVQNRGRGPVRPRPIDLSRTEGLGLHIVDAIAESWQVSGDGVIYVAFELQPP